MSDAISISSDADDRALRLAQRLRLNTDRLRRVVRSTNTLDGLSRQQESVLSILERQGPLTTAALARRERLRPQSMGTIVTGLMENGLVVKEPHPTDRRGELVQLTAGGVEAMARIGRIRDRDLAALIHSKLDPREQEILSQGLELLEELGDSFP